jgi:hypothetical protein
MKKPTTRRHFLRETAVFAAATVAMRAPQGANAVERVSGEMPMIELGDLQVSRVFLG